MNRVKSLVKEYMYPIVASIVLLMSLFLVTTQKKMWMDEILTFYPASSATFNDLIAFITDTINVGHYLYFILTWFWALVIGNSELSLRLFSALCICASIFIIWSLLRNIYGKTAATFTIFSVFLTSNLILYHNSEARFYGLLLLALVSLIYWTHKSSDYSFKKANVALQVFFHGALPLIHPFGFIYSTLVTFSVMLSDFVKGKLRWWYYLSAFAGWSFFLIFIKAFLGQMDLSNPHYWILKPDLKDLIVTYGLNHSLWYIGIFVIFIASVGIFVSIRSKKNQLLTIIAIALISLPVFIWIESQFFKSMYLDRYLIGYHIGLAIVVSALANHVFRKIKNVNLILYPTIFIGALHSLMFFVGNHYWNTLGQYPYDDSLYFLPYADLPIATDNPLLFFPNAYYGDVNKYYYILDWEVALDDRNELNATQDYKAMKALSYHRKELNIMESGSFLQSYDKFITWDNRAWFEVRLKDDPEYIWTEIGPKIFLVERVN